MAVNVAKFRQFGGFNAEETDDELTDYLNAAKEELTFAGVTERKASALYDLTVYQLATARHDNRGEMGEDGAKLPLLVQSAVHQLRNAAPEAVTDA